MFDLNQFGNRLSQERKRLGYTQASLADLTQVSLSSQRGYEAGARAPDAAYLARAQEIGMDIFYLVTGNTQDTTTIDWDTISNIIFTIDTWLDENNLELPFERRMQTLRYLYSHRKPDSDISPELVTDTVKLAVGMQ